MPPLQLHTSNRQEILSTQWAGLLREKPPATPFISDTVIVQSLGMRRWLQMELARHNGLCAGVEFPFPQAFVNRLLSGIYPDVSRELEFFERDVLQWRIYAWFSALPAREVPELERYFTGVEKTMKQWQLAVRMAYLFDQYAAYRPDWLLEWQSTGGADPDDWQARLWHHLTGGGEKAHPAALRQQLLRDLGSVDASLLPQRLTVFGLATLAPWYLEVLAALSQRIPVDLFVLQPTPEFWADLETAREVERRRQRGKPPLSPDMIWNPLLAAWGRTGRDFFKLLVQTEESVESPNFQLPSEEHLLAAVQRDLLNPERNPCRTVGRENEEDGSIRVHSCPGPMREVEIFYDQLLTIFEQRPGLEPRDVLVMVSNLETYAPLIDAVFGAPEKTQIPYSLADGVKGGDNGPGEVLLRLLETAESRFEITRVLGLLEMETIREKFDFSPPDIDRIRQWVIASGIRWGVDGAHREAETQLDFRQNSWEAGLERLLLGFAMESSNEELFGQILPLGEIEGSEGKLIGRFLEFFEHLRTLRTLTHIPVSLQTWAARLQDTLRNFFPPERLSTRGAFQLKAVLEELEKTAVLVPGRVPFAVLRLHLEKALQPDETQLGFLNGGVTFCACRPMRSIPFRVIALLGMNDGDFPRNPATSSLDRMPAEPRLGDRSLREDDRYFFLETLLSAREVFYLSYCGRSARDGKERRPSVVVSELLDYLDDQYGMNWSERILTKHPLQAFSPIYFEGGHLKSFSKENFYAASALVDAKGNASPWLSQPLSEPGLEWRTVTPQELAKFFTHPARYFVNRRVGMQLPEEGENLLDHEPFELGHLERYQLKLEALRAALSGRAATSEAWQASGVLPPGDGGKVAVAKLKVETELFLENLAMYSGDPELPPLEIDFTLQDIRITGTLNQRRAEGGLRFRPAKLKLKDQIEGWIEHLVANAIGLAEPMRLVAEDQTLLWESLSQDIAREHLLVLLNLYWRGLRQPLPFFPRSAAAYLVKRDLSAAGKEWHGSDFSQVEPESADAYFNLCFGHLENPLDQAFIEISELVLGPLPL